MLVLRLLWPPTEGGGFPMPYSSKAQRAAEKAALPAVLPCLFFVAIPKRPLAAIALPVKGGGRNLPRPFGLRGRKGQGEILPCGYGAPAAGQAYVAPNEGERKVLLLEDVQNMTEQAQNALLKVLEEPPASTVFLLTCQSRGQLLETILSR